MSRPVMRAKKKFTRAGFSIQLSLLITALVVAVMTVFTWLDIRTQRAVLYREMEDRGRLLVDTLGEMVVDPLYYLDVDQLADILGQVGEQADVLQAYIYDPDGQVIADSADPDYPTLVLKDEFSRQALQADGIIFQLSRDRLDVAGPIIVAGSRLGTIRVDLSLQTVEEKIAAERNACLRMTLALVILGFLLSLFLGMSVTRPIRRLAEAARVVGAGDLEHRTGVDRDDEIGDLAAAFDQMTQQLKETQERLVRIERLAAIGQLAASVGHELRNPLSVISSSVYYLKGELDGTNEKVIKHLERLERQTTVANQVITDLLDFSRLRPPALQPVSVNTVVEEALAQRPPPEKVRVTAELKEDLPHIMADAGQVQQVFTNVITNAYQAMTSASPRPGGGQLTVRTRAAGEFVEIIFADTGHGIPAENMPCIFEPLFTTRAQGIGLGLAICQRIVEGHRGTIEVESQEGVGTTFTVRLPVHPMHMTGEGTPVAQLTRIDT